MNLQEKFEARYVPEPNSGCWLWTAGVSSNGYGAFDGVGAHRFSYQLFKGRIPTGKIVRHKCDVKICVNPDHLLIGTQADNINDYVRRLGHHYSKRTHCKHGHLYTDGSFYTAKGARFCLICKRKWAAETRARRRANVDSMGPCSVFGCIKPIHVLKRALCRAHYKSWLLITRKEKSD